MHHVEAGNLSILPKQNENSLLHAYIQQTAQDRKAPDQPGPAPGKVSRYVLSCFRGLRRLLR